MEMAPIDSHPWFTYWLIVVKEAKYGLGLIGFKGSPNEKREVEIGYGIDPAFRGKGYMTEAVKALVAWAFSQENCKTITAPGVLMDNFGSQKVLETIGFAKVAEHDGKFNYVLKRAI